VLASGSSLEVGKFATVRSLLVCDRTLAMLRSVLDAAHFHDKCAAFDYLEQLVWPSGPVCPHCKAGWERIGILKGMRTKASRKNPEGLERYGLYKCYVCSKAFTVRAGTIFEHSHLALHLWLQVIHIMVCGKKDISTRQIQDMLNCSIKTAWFLTYHIRAITNAWSTSGTMLRCCLRDERMGFALVTRKASNNGTKQAKRFKKLAKDVGADESQAEFADVVRRLATAGPVRRKPLKARLSKP
jgi:transposase-like protein